MNSINNDKFSSFSTSQHASRGNKSPDATDKTGKLNTSVERDNGKDSLNLSPAGQHLSTSGKSDASRSIPESPEQAKALAAKIRHQFEQTGTQALNAYSTIQSNQMDLLQHPLPV